MSSNSPTIAAKLKNASRTGNERLAGAGPGQGWAGKQSFSADYPADIKTHRKWFTPH